MADEAAKRDSNHINVLTVVDNSGDKEIVQVQADSTTKRLLVDATTTVAGNAAIGGGSAMVMTLATPVQLPTVACKRAYVQSHESNGDLTNGGAIVIGGSDVVASTAGRIGMTLYPTQGDWFTVSNLNLLYADSVDSCAYITYFFEI